ncbi:putative phage tail protein [Salibacterium aidingense]|uniref:putative phage tail protein n=1 Tax=Salibacterium aidingense TaxID=384933 RepID=UPI003BE2A956
MTLRRRDINEAMVWYMPEFYEEFAEVQAEITAEATEIGDLFGQIRDVHSQFYVDTATWGIPVWEREVGITSDNSRPLSRRRTEIKSRLRGFGALTSEKLTEIINAYDESIGYSVDDPAYTITFTFPAGIVRKETTYFSVADFRVGYSPAEFVDEAAVNMTEFQKDLRKLMPAHFAIDFAVTENTAEVEVTSELRALQQQYRSVSEFNVGDAFVTNSEEVAL